MRVRCPHCQIALDIIADEPSQKFVTCPSCGSQLDVGDSVDTVTYRQPRARTVGHFDLLEHVGRGHFGDVWRARDNVLGRVVAVKIPRAVDLEPETVGMFMREAQAAAKLRHNNIVAVHEVGQDGDTIYIVSDFVHGMPLSQFLRDHPLTPRDAATICMAVAEALQHAHDQGIIHRDLKPSNIMLDADHQPHILDFGLAKQEASEFTMTMQGDVLGTPAYMSPEQARGDSAKSDARSDVYSLGVVLYELLAGRRPFIGVNRLLVQQVLNDEPPPPRRFNRKAPRDLETICLKALSKAPRHRYQSAQEMADDLRRYLQGQPIQARRVSLVGHGWRWARRNPALAGSMAAMIVLTLFVGLLWGKVISHGPVRQRVVVTTEPPGARLALVPIDPDTGRLRIDEKILPTTRSPATIKLVPGEYLVVADIPNRGFHEVYRYVPAKLNEAQQAAYPHGNWIPLPDGGVEWPIVKIPVTGAVTSGMVSITGGSFTMGTKDLVDTPPHTQTVDDFLVDAYEVTVEEFQSLMGTLPSSLMKDVPLIDPQAAVRCVRFDSARKYAELAGKRLLTESEYEFAATQRGTSRYPWGDQDPPFDEWKLERVGQPAEDKTATEPPIFGLYSNVAEWTDTVGMSYFHLWPEAFGPASDPQGMRLLELDSVLKATMRLNRVVRGAPLDVIHGREATKDTWQSGSRQRIWVERTQEFCGVGMRCARSAKPRFLTP